MKVFYIELGMNSNSIKWIQIGKMWKNIIFYVNVCDKLQIIMCKLLNNCETKSCFLVNKI